MSYFLAYTLNNKTFSSQNYLNQNTKISKKKKSGPPVGGAVCYGSDPPLQSAVRLVFWAARGPGYRGSFEKKQMAGLFLKLSFFCRGLIKMAASLHALLN